MSLSVLAQDNEGVFQCAASVAPVVDWRLYDTYYTVSKINSSSQHLRFTSRFAHLFTVGVVAIFHA